MVLLFSLPLTMDHEVSIPKEPSEATMFFHEKSKRNINHKSHKEYQLFPYKINRGKN